MELRRRGRIVGKGESSIGKSSDKRDIQRGMIDNDAMSETERKKDYDEINIGNNDSSSIRLAMMPSLFFLPFLPMNYNKSSE